MFVRLSFLIELAFVIKVFKEKWRFFCLDTLSISNRISLKRQFLDNLDQLQTLGVTTNTGQVLIYEDWSGSAALALVRYATTAAQASQLCGRNAHQPKRKSPSSQSTERTHLLAVLLHISSVPCFKFFMREKVIFTPSCVRDFFEVFIQGSWLMRILCLSPAIESKGNTVDIVIAWRCPQQELVLKLDIFFTLFLL